MAVAVFLLAAGSSAGPSGAAELYSGAASTLRWDNTIRYSGAVRLENPSVLLLSDINADDGNRNFRSGLISNRADLLSELGVSFGDLGIEASAAAWYDTQYNRHTDNDSPATFNSTSVSHRQLSKATERLHGRDAEILNAYVYGNGAINDRPVSFRIGRSTVLWGESLFFSDNGIAAGQAPVDTIKGFSVPGSKAQEVYRPVGQAWASAQPAPGVSLEAYYQFEWRKSRLPGAGSYFSAADYIDAGGERLIVGPGQFFARGQVHNVSDSGQYGVALRLSGDHVDAGFYALRFTAKEPQIYLRFGPFLGRPTATSASTFAESQPSGHERERSALYGLTPGVIIGGPGSPLRFNYALYGNPATGEVGTFDLAYPRGIELYGLSLNGYLGDSTVAGEVSMRHRTPLISQPLIVLPNVYANASSSPLYAVGDSLHAQASIVSVLPPNSMWDGATFAAEIAASHRARTMRNETALDPSRTRSALSLRASVEPQYFAVLPGLDLTVPVGFGYGVSGRSSVNQSQNERVGDVEIGVRMSYRATWQASLMLTHFFGPAGRQPFADRDFISFSVQRTF